MVAAGKDLGSRGSGACVCVCVCVCVCACVCVCVPAGAVEEGDGEGGIEGGDAGEHGPAREGEGRQQLPEPAVARRLHVGVVQVLLHLPCVGL